MIITRWICYERERVNDMYGITWNCWMTSSCLTTEMWDLCVLVIGSVKHWTTYMGGYCYVPLKWNMYLKYVIGKCESVDIMRSYYMMRTVKVLESWDGITWEVANERFYEMEFLYLNVHCIWDNDTVNVYSSRWNIWQR